MTDFNTMSGPDLVKAFNEMAPKLNLNPVKKFRTLEEGRKRCVRTAELVSAFAHKPKEEKPPKEKKPKTRAANGIRIAVVVDKNPKREGSSSFKRFEEMMAYVAKHPQCALGEVIEQTSYRMGDYNWDLDHEFIRKV